MECAHQNSAGRAVRLRCAGAYQNSARRAVRLRCAGAYQENGVTLIELVLVITIMALVAALTFPTASAALDSLRLRTASERVVGLLYTALDRADRVQQVIEIRISPEDNAISARSADLSLNRTLQIPAPVRISSTGPELPIQSAASGVAAGGVPELAALQGQRRYLLYPGGSPPHLAIELETPGGRKRMITVDPVTGMLRSQLETQP